MSEEEIMELYEEIMKLREQSRILRKKFNEIDEQHSEKMIEINKLRTKDERYVWCKTHNKKHNIKQIIADRHRIQPIYDECLFKEDHIWILTGLKKWIQPKNKHYLEDFVDIYGETECMTCKLITWKQVIMGMKSEYPDMEELIVEGINFRYTGEMIIG